MTCSYDVAAKLVIGAKNGTRGNFRLTIDEKFRRALWDESLWMQ